MELRTTTRMIEDLRDPANSGAWERFDSRYRPVLVGFGRRLGFSEDDATELAQRTMAEFAEAYLVGRYDRGKGKLSSWLIGMARNIGSKMRRSPGIAHKVGGDTMADGVPAELQNDQHLTLIWERERELAILAEAMDILRSTTKTEAHTLRVFELVVVRGVTPETAASECGMSVDGVYAVKNRLTKRLREIVRDRTAAYDSGE